MRMRAGRQTGRHVRTQADTHADRQASTHVHMNESIHACTHVHSKTNALNEPQHDKTNKMICASSEDSDQPGHPTGHIPTKVNKTALFIVIVAFEPQHDKTNKMTCAPSEDTRLV